MPAEKTITSNPFKLMPALLDSYRFGQKYSSDLKLKVGDKAPDFELPNLHGDNIRLSDLLSQHKVILIFYRGGWCPFCNLQLRLYQNTIPEFSAYGANIVAISPEVLDHKLAEEEK